jgi:hypothetical protein
MVTAETTIQFDGFREKITGVIGKNEAFDIAAVSGGSRGHKPLAKQTAADGALNTSRYRYAEAEMPTSHYANTPQIGGENGKPYLQRGGTLYPGHYTCHYLADYKHFHECIRLAPGPDTNFYYPTASGAKFTGRTGFYIHGQGVLGSDGCIVIVDGKERHRLNTAIRDFKGTVKLLVSGVAYLLPAEGGMFL